MEKTQKPHQLQASIILFFILISSSLYSLASARVLFDYHYIPQSLAATTEPEAAAFSIALPSDKVEALKKEAADINKQQHPCDQYMEANGVSSSLKLGRKYQPLVLNILPKGTVPPSGPSKGTNDVNN